MRNSMHILLFAFALMASCASVAQQHGIEMKVEHRDVMRDASFSIILVVNGGDISQILTPADVEGLEINTKGHNTHQSTRIQVVNGSFSQVTNHTYVFTAKTTKLGKITIPPFHAVISGKEFVSNTVDIMVSEGTGSLDLNPNLSQRERWDKKDNKKDKEKGVVKEPTLEDIVYIACEADRDEVYQGELVMLRLRLGNLKLSGARTNISGARSIPQIPATEGFYRGPEELKNDEIFKAGDFEYRGVEYYIPLYPTRPGDFEIGPWVWEGTVQGPVRGYGLQSQVIRKASELAKVNVKPLPDRPKNFSGAVGSYDFRVRLDSSNMKQGVPTNLELVVSGYGNPDAIGAFNLPDLGWANVSSPEILTDRPDKSDWSFSNRTFLYKLTPANVGKFTFPSLDFTYFDPEIEEYRTKSAPIIEVEVQESSESNQLVTMGGATQPKAPSEARIHSGELAPPIREVDTLRPTRSSGTLLNTLAISLPVGAYLCCFALVYRRRRMEDNPLFARRLYARKRSQELLTGLEEQSDPSAVLFKALASFVADRFGVSADGLTSEDVRRLMRERGIQKELCDTTYRILQACERARFAGRTLQVNEVRALRHAAEDAMNELEAITDQGSRT